MKLIVGLGNPGDEYKETRHNVGWKVLDKLRQARIQTQFQNSGQAVTTNFQLQSKFQAEVVKIDDLLLIKPWLFMNRSGEVVQKLAHYYQVEDSNVWVVHDDLDLRLGEYKISIRGPKDHNGVNSIRTLLGDSFWKVRVGIDNRGSVSNAKDTNSEDMIMIADKAGRTMISGEEYVLGRFALDEQKLIDLVITRVVDELMKLIYQR